VAGGPEIPFIFLLRSKKKPARDASPEPVSAFGRKDKSDSLQANKPRPRAGEEIPAGENQAEDHPQHDNVSGATLFGDVALFQ